MTHFIFLSKISTTSERRPHQKLVFHARSSIFQFISRLLPEAHEILLTPFLSLFVFSLHSWLLSRSGFGWRTLAARLILTLSRNSCCPSWVLMKTLFTRNQITSLFRRNFKMKNWRNFKMPWRWQRRIEKLIFHIFIIHHHINVCCVRGSTWDVECILFPLLTWLTACYAMSKLICASNHKQSSRHCEMATIAIASVTHSTNC